MGNKQHVEDRWFFIEKIQDWFQRKTHFWFVIGILSLTSVLVLQYIFNFASQTNPSVRQQAEFLVMPILSLFVFSIFWRNIVCTFLSLVGAMMTNGGMVFFHRTDVTTQLASPYVANRLGYGIKHAAVISPNSVADVYFIAGVLALTFCLIIAIKPNFFKPKDPDVLPYPVWKYSKNFEMSQKSGTVRLIPVSALLSYAEQHLVTRYKYVALAIGGREYLVTPYEWIPENSVVIRDEKSNTIIGIP